MAQATTLTDAQFKRALRYCQARRHVTRDTTILLFSLYTGLRAIELAALRVGDVYGDDGAPRKQFILSKFQTKGASPRTVFVNKQLAQQLVVYGKWRHCRSYCQIWCLRVVGHAAIWSGFVVSIPSLNVTPVMTFAR
jgi:integrase/recombinase XerD